jgi:1-acyl-sn-glycerol-3-phosphate acyltransferase
MKEMKGILSLVWKLYVGVLFVALAVLLYPFFYLLLLYPSWKKSSFKLFVFWSWCMRFFCFYPVKKIRNAKLPEGPYIIIANHSSYLDIFFLPSLLSQHPFLFLGKSELLGYPILRTYFKNLNIPVYRTNRSKAAQSFKAAKKAVQEGWSIAMFPEGTIPSENNPKMLPFKYGAFKLAKEMQLPIVPVTFTNNYRLFSDPEQLLGPARPGFFKVYIHPFVSQELVNELSISELSMYCFNQINQPILEEHPSLADT